MIKKTITCTEGIQRTDAERQIEEFVEKYIKENGPERTAAFMCSLMLTWFGNANSNKLRTVINAKGNKLVVVAQCQVWSKGKRVL